MRTDGERKQEDQYERANKIHKDDAGFYRLGMGNTKIRVDDKCSAVEGLDKGEDLDTVLSRLSERQKDLAHYLFDTFLKYGQRCLNESGKVIPSEEEVVFGKRGLRLRLRMNRLFLSEIWSFAANGRLKAIEEYTESKRK